MSEDRKYNGWTNYETWNVALWLDNEQGSYNYWNETAQEVYDEAEADNTFTKEENATLDLMRRLESEIEEGQPELGASMWADLLGAALSEVDWHEIAEHYIAEVDKPVKDQECQNCGKLWAEDELNSVEDIPERVAPGEVMPTGECPECGAVCHPAKVKS